MLKITEIEKAIGEGSKGGKVIGHTYSGKPIYENFDNLKHSNFDKMDHEDAEKVHYKRFKKKYPDIKTGRKNVRGYEIIRKPTKQEMNEDKDYQEMNKHYDARVKLSKCNEVIDDLEKAITGEGSRGGKIIGRTKSGKPIYANFEQENSKKYNFEDHSDAVSAHLKEAKKHFKSDKEKSKHHSQIAQLHFNAMNNKLDNGKLEKAFTIGTTNSGKDVYKNYNERAYKNFTPEDHEEAAKLHRNLAAKQDRTTDAGQKAYKTHMSQAGTHSRYSKSMNIYKKQDMNIEKAFSSLGLEVEEEKMYFEKAEFDTESRKKLAKKGEALSDGSFPIRNKRDLKNAIHDVGRANDPEKAKRWIKKRAKDLDAEEVLPEDWKEGNEDKKIEKAFSFLGLDFSKAETEEVDEEELTEPAEMSDAELIECISEGKGDRVRQAKKELEYRLKIKKQSENF